LQGKKRAKATLTDREEIYRELSQRHSFRELVERVGRERHIGVVQVFLNVVTISDLQNDSSSSAGRRR
jgi:hypothetical protein